jgi:protein CWC15
LTGNPLLNQQLFEAQGKTDFSLKRKWYNETVFKNQARSMPEIQKRFINDTVRSDFHRRFLARAIQ